MSWFSDWLHRHFPWLFPPPKPPPPPPPPGDRRFALFAAINSQRAAQVRPPLRCDSRLDTAAQSWAEQMARSGVLAHGDWSARIAAAGYHARDDAENIEEGQATAAECLAAWMGSAGHRANLLGDYRDVGLGAAVDARGVWYWCADFGTE